MSQPSSRNPSTSAAAEALRQRRLQEQRIVRVTPIASTSASTAAAAVTSTNQSSFATNPSAAAAVSVESSIVSSRRPSHPLPSSPIVDSAVANMEDADVGADARYVSTVTKLAELGYNRSESFIRAQMSLHPTNDESLIDALTQDEVSERAIAEHASNASALLDLPDTVREVSDDEEQLQIDKAIALSLETTSAHPSSSAAAASGRSNGSNNSIASATSSRSSSPSPDGEVTIVPTAQMKPSYVPPGVKRDNPLFLKQSGPQHSSSSILPAQVYYAKNDHDNKKRLRAQTVNVVTSAPPVHSLTAPPVTKHRETLNGLMNLLDDQLDVVNPGIKANQMNDTGVKHVYEASAENEEEKHLQPPNKKQKFDPRNQTATSASAAASSKKRKEFPSTNFNSTPQPSNNNALPYALDANKRPKPTATRAPPGSHFTAPKPHFMLHADTKSTETSTEQADLPPLERIDSSRIVASRSSAVNLCDDDDDDVIIISADIRHSQEDADAFETRVKTEPGLKEEEEEDEDDQSGEGDEEEDESSASGDRTSGSEIEDAEVATTDAPALAAEDRGKTPNDSPQLADKSKSNAVSSPPEVSSSPVRTSSSSTLIAPVRYRVRQLSNAAQNQNGGGILLEVANSSEDEEGQSPCKASLRTRHASNSTSDQSAPANASDAAAALTRSTTGTGDDSTNRMTDISVFATATVPSSSPPLHPVHGKRSSPAHVAARSRCVITMTPFCPLLMLEWNDKIKPDEKITAASRASLKLRSLPWLIARLPIISDELWKLDKQTGETEASLTGKALRQFFDDMEAKTDKLNDEYDMIEDEIKVRKQVLQKWHRLRKEYSASQKQHQQDDNQSNASAASVSKNDASTAANHPLDDVDEELSSEEDGEDDDEYDDESSFDDNSDSDSGTDESEAGEGEEVTPPTSPAHTSANSSSNCLPLKSVDLPSTKLMRAKVNKMEVDVLKRLEGDKFDLKQAKKRFRQVTLESNAKFKVPLSKKFIEEEEDEEEAEKEAKSPNSDEVEFIKHNHVPVNAGASIPQLPALALSPAAAAMASTSEMPPLAVHIPAVRRRAPAAVGNVILKPSAPAANFTMITSPTVRATAPPTADVPLPPLVPTQRARPSAPKVQATTPEVIDLSED